ncbi:hypothetical protein SGO26_30250 (plasmid) [Cupriavidus metallidurans]|uniref:hypothetical protein n=1 Tax=Cupriavidus metallidurans TaxID=119219 RepID=UPI003D717CE9
MNKLPMFLALLAGASAVANAQPLLESALPPAIPFEGQSPVVAGTPLAATGQTYNQQQEMATQNVSQGQGTSPTGPELRLVLAMGNVAVVKETDQSGKILRTTTLHDGAHFFYKGRDVKVAVKDGSLRLLDGGRTLMTAQVNSISEAQDGPNSATRTSAEMALSAGNGVKELKSNQFGFASLQNSTGTNNQQTGMSAVPR